MSIKKWNESTQQWEIVALNNATTIPILDLKNNYESNNVEGALREAGEGLKQTKINNERLSIIEYKLNDHIINHPSSGGGSILPTIESSFTIDTADAKENINIPIYFVSPNLGEGICYININDIEIATQTIEQGDNIIRIPALGNGIFKIDLKVKDRYGLFSNKLSWTVTCGGIEINLLSNFSTFIPLGKEVFFDYEIITNVSETIYLHLTINGTEQIVETTSGKHSLKLSDLELGVHEIEYYAEVGKYRTNIYNANIVISNAESLYLSSRTKSPITVLDGEPVIIDYCVSKVSEEDFIIRFTLDDVTTAGTCKSGTYKWSNDSLSIGTHNLNIFVKDSDFNTASLDFVIEIIEDIEFQRIECPQYKLIAWWDASDNKNNLYDDRNIWVDKISGITATLHNFNYSSNGWMNDLDTNEYWLECNGNAYVEIPYAPFENNFEEGGTIDILFKTNDVGNIDARVLDITSDVLDDGKPLGCYINTYEAFFKSDKHKSSVVISEDEYIRITYVIDRTEKCGKIYVDGILTDAFVLTDTEVANKKVLESFAHNSYIYLNSTKGNGYGSSCIKQLRIYNRPLTHDEVVILKISDIKDKALQRERYNFNFNNKTIPKVYFTFNMQNLDSNKYGKIPLTMTYDSPNSDLYGTGFSSTKCYIYQQGTSSLGYTTANFNTELRDESGNVMYFNPFKGTAKPESLFCFKANVMDSSFINNIKLAAFGNDCLYDENTYNDAQIKDMQVNGLDKPQVRHTVAGFPVYLYVKDTSKPNAEFEPYCIYDFNTDRYSPNTFGYSLYEDGKCLCYEAAANTQTGAAAFNKYTDASGKDPVSYYKDEFKLIYPLTREGNDDYKEIARLVEFVSDAGIENFKADLPKYFNVQHLIRYYIFVNVFGLVDSLGKNMKLVSFDGGITWSPQLYDMDTALGLNNSGLITFDVDIEPEHNSSIDDENVAFNTSASKLWVKLHEFMLDEIKQEYQKLRADKLTLENIMKYLYDDGIAKIPETFYNESMQQRYMNYGEGYMAIMHGSRYHHIKKWVRERLLYMDTFMGFNASINDFITIRAQAMNEVNLEIEPYSPMYIKVKWTNAGDEDSQAYSTVRVKRGETASLSTLLSSNDQEVLIYGGQYIKRLKNLTSLKPKTLLLSAATRLVELECHSNILYQLSIDNCKLLQRIDVSNCTNLGTYSAATQVLNLDGCTNLRYINIFNTALTALKTDNTGNIEEIYYPYGIRAVELYNQNNLKILGLPTEIIYDKELNHELNKLPNLLEKFFIYNCPNIKSIRKEYSEYNYFSNNYFMPLYYTNLIDINSSFNSLSTIDLSYCNNLSMLGLYNLNNLNILNFNNLNNSNGTLKNIYLSGCDSLETINIDWNDKENDNNYYPKFNDAILDLSSCKGLKTVSSNYPIKGLKTIILPVNINEEDTTLHYSNFKNLVFTDNYNTNIKSDIENIYARFSDVNNNIDLKDIKLDQLNLQTIDKPLTITNLYLNVKTAEDVNINKYRTQDNQLSISGTYDFSNYQENSMNSLFKNINLTNIILKSDEFLNNIHDISSCFENAIISESTNLNNFLSKLNNVTNCFRTFKNSSGIIIGPNLNMDLVINASEMFYNCNHMESIPNYNLSGLIDASYMFYNCRSLLINFALNLSKCQNIDYIFYDCRNINNLLFESNNSITTASYAFANCINLSDIQIFDTSSVINMSYMFYNCKKLLTIPDLLLMSAKNLAYTFYNCKLMTGTADPNKYWLNENIEEYTLCFANCSKLSNFYPEPPEGVPDEWGGLYDNIGEDDMEIKIIANESTYPVSNYLPTFYSYYQHNLLKTNYSAWKLSEINSYDICLRSPIQVSPGQNYRLTNSNIQSISIISVDENNNYLSHIIGNDISSIDTSDISFTIPDNCSYINVLYRTYGSFPIEECNAKLINTDRESETLSYINISITKTDDTITLDTTIPISQVNNIYIKFDPNTTYIDFSNNNYLESINSIDLSNCPICDYMFMNCENLVKIDSLDTTNVRSMIGTFMNCLNLKNIESFDISLCENISNVFYNCTSLESIPYVELDNLIYMDKAFYNCILLNGFDFNTLKNVCGMYYSFYKCENIKAIGDLNTGKCINFDYSFYGCKQLKTINSIDVSNAESMISTFQGCRNLISSLNFNTSKVNNMNKLFYGCSNLRSIIYLDTSNVVNTASLFEGCSNLISVPILNYHNVTDISRMFYECILLKEITMANTNNILNMNRTFYNCRSLQKTIGLNTNSVQNFSYAFYGCISLAELSIDVTNMENMSYAFYNCSNLSNIEFTNDSTTSHVFTFAYTFSGCSNLVESPILNTSSCTNISYIYNDCINLVNAHLNSWTFENIKSLIFIIRNCKSISQDDIDTIIGWNMNTITSLKGLMSGTSITQFDVSNWNISNVTDVSYMFSECFNLISIIGIEDFISNSINDISHMFNRCSSLLSLNISNWNTSNVKDLSYFCYNCSSLENINISNWDTSNIISFYNSFNNCGFTTLDLSGWNFESAKSLQNMLSNCRNLTELKINTNYNNIEVMQDMVSGCEKLTTIPDTFYLYGSADNVFNNCSSLTNIENIIINCENANSIFNNCTNLISINSFIVNESSSITFAFNGCINLTQINDFQINTMQDILLNNMFNNCSSLISLSGIIKNVKNMCNMFFGCNNLETLDMTNWDLSNCIDTSYMLYDCISLKEIIANNNELNTSLVQDMSCMFYNCESLTRIPYLYMDSCIYITGLLYGCIALTEIYNMQTKSFNSSNVTNMDNAFNNCINLLYFPILNTSSCISMIRAFYNCSNMTGSVNALDYWNRTPAISSYKECFYKCTSLSNYNSEIPSTWKGTTTVYTSNINNEIFVNTSSLNNEKEELKKELQILLDKINELNKKIDNIS